MVWQQDLQFDDHLDIFTAISFLHCTVVRSESKLWLCLSWSLPYHQIFKVRITVNICKSICEAAHVIKMPWWIMRLTLPCFYIWESESSYWKQPCLICKGGFSYHFHTLLANPQASYEQAWALQLCKWFWLLQCDYVYALWTIKKIEETLKALNMQLCTLPP